MLTDSITQLVATYLDPRDLLAWLLVFMGFDFATGIVASIREGKVNSSIGWLGLWKKVATVLALIFIIVVTPFASAYMAGYSTHLDVIATLAFVGIEIISILENLGRSGVKTEFLAQYFEKVAPKSPPTE